MMIPEKEVWRDIPGYEGLYQVSSLGNVLGLQRMSLRNGKTYQNMKSKILKKCNGGGGYFVLNLSKNGRRILFQIHRLVAMSFYSNPENKRTVNHINGIKTDNRLINLEWATDQEQSVHSYATGLKKAVKKIPDICIPIVREAFKCGYKQPSIAMYFGVSQSLISRIIQKNRRADA